MLLTFRSCTFCCIHHCWTQVILWENVCKNFIDCWLYIVYMYQWQNQHALLLVPGWILVPSDPWRWQEKLLYSVVMALTSTLCAALHGQSNVGSMCDCKPCWSLDLSVLVEILSGVVSDHGTGRKRNGSVNSRSTLCPMEGKKVMLTKDTPLSSHLAVYVL